MKIAIDVREAYREQKAGKGQWTRMFYNELQTRNLDILPLGDDSFPRGFQWHIKATSFARTNNIDAYVSPTSLIVPSLLGKKIKTVPIIHDLIAFMGEPHNAKAKLIEKLLLKRTVETASHICCVSDSTKADLLNRFPNIPKDCISTIYAGPMQSNPQKSVPDGRTILCVGTLCPRKNQLRLVKAFASLPEPYRSQYKLILVGSRGWQDSSIVSAASSVKGVEWRDYVTDDEYMELLSSATVFAYPSLYEGFGMQVLDALQRGIPTITSSRGSLQEVVGDAAVVVNPEDEKSIAEGLLALLTNEALRTELSNTGPKQAQQFSWKKTVDLFLEGLQKALY